MNQVLNLWVSQIPNYQSLVNKCLVKLSKPISFIPPADIENRTERLKELLSNNYQSEYDFVDVVVNLIEGKKNMTIMELAKVLSDSLGRDAKYWQDRILQYADNQVYAQNLTIWGVKKNYQSYLYLTPETISNLRKFRKITKGHLCQLKNIIKVIKKAQGATDLPKIDEAYLKLKASQEKYYGFLQEIEFDPTGDYGQHSNTSLAARKNAKKTLFNFMKLQPVRNSSSQNTFPLTYYNFQVSNQKYNNHNMFSKRLSERQQKQLDKNFKFMQKPIFSTNELREQFSQENKYEKNSKQSLKQSQWYTNIWDNCYYFNYHLYSVEKKPLIFTQPYHQYQFINYDINSEDQYNDLLGEDIYSNAQRSEEEVLTSSRSFLVSDGHLSDDEISEPQPKIDLEKYIDEKWQFNKEHIVNGFEMIALVDLPVKIDISALVMDATDQQLGIIVHKKTRKQIFSIIQTMKQTISKQRLQDYLKKNCTKKKKKNGIIYIVNTLQNILTVENVPMVEILQNSAQKYSSSRKQQVESNSCDATNDNILN